jgi:hypothetical protein
LGEKKLPQLRQFFIVSALRSEAAGQRFLQTACQVAAATVGGRHGASRCEQEGNGAGDFQQGGFHDSPLNVH